MDLWVSPQRSICYGAVQNLLNKDVEISNITVK